MSEKSGAGYGPLEFTVRRSVLAQMAEWAVAAVPAGPVTQAVNSCFQVTVSPERLALAAADQRLAVFTEVQAVIAQSAGQVYLPARKLKAILAEARDGDVTVSAKGSQALVTAGSAAWHLRLFPPDGYTGLPDLSDAQFAPVSREVLRTALETVRHAVSKDGGRPSFTQVRIAASDEGMFACAAGSNQFSRAPVPGFPCDMLIPGPALDDLVRLLAKSQEDKVEVAAAGPYAVFRAGPVTMAALRTAKDFPDTDKLFLQLVRGNDMTLRVDRDELTAAIRRVRINADTTTSAVALIADSDDGKRGRLTVTSRDKDANSAEEVIPAEWEHGLTVLAVNAVFLSAALAVHPSPVCEFKVGKDRGKVRAPLLLEDSVKQVSGICYQMPASLAGC
jgi:DNA polymerase III sliding clamp (beta) subunit (PCNA family)